MGVLLAPAMDRPGGPWTCQVWPWMASRLLKGFSKAPNMILKGSKQESYKGLLKEFLK